MARLVPDASATLTWCFEDEAMPWTDAVLAKLRAGDEGVVPAHWPAEVANALLIAVRRGRISREKANRFFLDLRALAHPHRSRKQRELFSIKFLSWRRNIASPSTMRLILN